MLLRSIKDIVYTRYNQLTNDPEYVPGVIHAKGKDLSCKGMRIALMLTIMSYCDDNASLQFCN